MPRMRIARPVAGLVAAALALTACRQVEPPTNRVEADDSEPAVNLPAAPQVPETIDRAALLGAIAEAASAFAAGTDDRAAQAALNGKPFAILMPFGCEGIVPASGDSLSLTLRPGARSYEVRAAPSIDAAAAGIDTAKDAATPSPIQSVEGFWIPRPWMLAAACPAPRGNAVVDPAMTMTGGEAAPGDTSAGIARYVAEGESRLANRAGRDYRKIVTLAEGELPPKGLYLLLEGRLRTWPDGKVIACRDTARRPSCIAAATIDRAAIEKLDDQSVIAEWTGN